MLRGSPVGIPARTVPLWGGDVGVYQTLAAMRREARSFAACPAYRALAIALVGGASDATAQWRTLRTFLLTNTIYEDDPDDVELVHTPYEQLRRIQVDGVMRGDCDDVATLAAGLVRALGRPARLVVLGFGPDFSHVYTEMQTPAGAWLDFDLTRTAIAPRATRKEVWTI